MDGEGGRYKTKIDMSRLILVLGCHRSGTSVVTRSLQALGVNLGERLMGPAYDNPEGFYEDIDILNIDQKALESIGSDWFRTSLNVEELKKLADMDFGQNAEMVLRAKIADHPVFGIKDPRLCRLMPFWRPIFSRIGLDVSVVHVVRNPMACARSLEKRNRLTEAHALRLWERYNIDAMTGIDRTWPKVTVDYDRFLVEPVEELDTIRAALNLTRKPGTITPMPDPSLNHRNGALLPHHGSTQLLWEILSGMAQG